MTREQNIEQIRAACIKANPEIETRQFEEYDDDTIRLADVLLAIESRKHVGIQANGCFIVLVPGDPIGSYELAQKYSRWHEQYQTHVWNLRKDDLTEQSDETISFLAELLK